MKYVDVIIRDEEGKIICDKRNVEAPDSWSDNAVKIAAQKFMAANENSVVDMCRRIATTLVKKAPWLIDYDAQFEEKLFDILIHQRAAFNSPVWFNLGVLDDPMLCACYILEIQDSLDSIFAVNTESGNIFKYGGGAGINYSAIRAKDEPLSHGGKASGPISFVKGHDATAGMIKSGGKTRRAAKMVILDADHPDIEEFIEVKKKEEDKIRYLIQDPKYRNPGNPLESEAALTVAFQNGNNSVRVTDEFMRAAMDDKPWELTARTTGEVLKTVRARDLLHKIAECIWDCGDPGIQFDTTINRWNTIPHVSKIKSSNPCSEFMFIDNSACNLSSFTLWRYLDQNNKLDEAALAADVSIVFAAQDAICDLSKYPNEKIRHNSHTYRPLGLGPAGLGSLFMRKCIAYGSDHSVELTHKAIRAMSIAAWRASERLYTLRGSLMSEQDQASIRGIVAQQYGIEIGNVRNAQVTLAAPTGTIGLTMDSDTFGIEPFFALRVTKHMVGGATMVQIAEAAQQALSQLGYNVAEAEKYIADNGTLRGFVTDTHLPIFACAIGDNSLAPEAHLRIMAAVQKYISGAISKTVNLPSSATVDDIERTIRDAWHRGIKSLTIYRDGSKASQPLTTGSTVKDAKKVLPLTRKSVTHKIGLINGVRAYLTVSEYPDGSPAEIFLNLSDGGETLAAMADMWAISMCMNLQNGIPVDSLISKFRGRSFEPAGMTINEEIPTCSSIVDYVMQFLEKHYNARSAPKVEYSAMRCANCKSDRVVRNGTCWLCEKCGTTTSCG